MGVGAGRDQGGDAAIGEQAARRQARVAIGLVPQFDLVDAVVPRPAAVGQRVRAGGAADDEVEVLVTPAIGELARRHAERAGRQGAAEHARAGDLQRRGTGGPGAVQGLARVGGGVRGEVRIGRTGQASVARNESPQQQLGVLQRAVGLLDLRVDAQRADTGHRAGDQQADDGGDDGKFDEGEAVLGAVAHGIADVWVSRADYTACAGAGPGSTAATAERDLEQAHRRPIGSRIGVRPDANPCSTTNRIPQVRITVSNFDQQLEKIRSAKGFIAALDQSGGSTPKALRLYGIDEDAWSSEDEMFDLVHQMRTRIMTSPAFTGERILAAILFEMTMDREVAGKPTADYLWGEKRVVPILKVDKGLAEEGNGVQLMKPMPDLDKLLARAKDKGIFGTKMRSVVKQANAAGIDAIVAQQFEIGRQICAAGLVPIIEPEVDIHCPEKAAAEDLLKAGILTALDKLGENELVMLKLTLPERDDFYAECIAHKNVARVVALSGGYSRDDANARLARNHGMVASFSRALTEGLSAQQSDAAFNSMLDASIESIYQASIT